MWVQSQRGARETMAPERKARLEELEWWVWSARVTTEWDARYDELVAYHTEHGRLPPQSVRGLGVWVQSQRGARETMAHERKARLEELEWWSWSLRTEWDARYDELVAYHAEHGMIPPRSVRELGEWTSNQRRRRATMAPERKARLEELEWWVWTVRAA